MSEIQATLHGGEAAIGPEVLGADRVARTTLSADDRPLVRYVLEIGLDRTADVAFAFPFLDRDQLRVTAVLTLGGATHTATLGAQVNAVDSLWPPPGAAVEYEVRTTTAD